MTDEQAESILRSDKWFATQDQSNEIADTIVKLRNESMRLKLELSTQKEANQKLTEKLYQKQNQVWEANGLIVRYRRMMNRKMAGLQKELQESKNTVIKWQEDLFTTANLETSIRVDEHVKTIKGVVNFLETLQGKDAFEGAATELAQIVKSRFSVAVRKNESL